MKPGAGRIRIIGGHLRNSRLEVAALAGLRPTPERVREKLFNWLVPHIAGANCLDLCAGTGALGIEALSRGAASVQFVEPDAGAARALQANLVRLKLDRASLAVDRAERFLAGPVRPFEVVFLDPPFSAHLWSSLAEQLESGWLVDGALIHVEWPQGAIPLLPSAWLLQREGRAGAVSHALYRRTVALPLS